MITLPIIISIIFSLVDCDIVCYPKGKEPFFGSFPNKCMQNSANSSFTILDVSNDFSLSGSVIQSSFELPNNVSTFNVINKSSNLNVSCSTNNLGEGIISFQTPNLDGEYYASFNLPSNEGVNMIANAYIYSENGVDSFSNSSIEDAKMKYFLEYVATEEDLVFLGLEDIPNNFLPTKSQHDAYNEFNNFVFGNADITMFYASTSQNLSDKIRVKGTVTWYDKNYDPHPLSNALIGLYDDDVFWEQLCESTYTNDNGYFCFETYDETFMEFDGRDLFLKLSSKTQATRVVTANFDQLLNAFTFDSYVFCSQILSSPCPNKEYICDIRIYPWMSDRAAAFEICQAELLPYRYIGLINNSYLPQIPIYYPNITSNLFVETNYYFRELGYISICKRYYNDWDTLNHEYGHYICDYFNLCAPSFLTEHIVGKNYVETHGIQNGLKLALSEGLATYIGICSSLTFGASLGVPEVGDEKYAGYNFYADFSLYHYGESYDDFGEGNELSVTSLLLKIMDDYNRYYDNVNLGHYAMWNILRSNNHWCLSSLIQSIILAYPNISNDVSLLMEKEFLVPVQYVGPNQILSTNENDACWTFSWDINQYSNPVPTNYSLVFSNSFSNSYTINNIALTSFSLTIEQINTILSFPGSTVEWSINSLFDYSNGIITGPYSTTHSSMTKPVPSLLYNGQNGNYHLSIGERKWFKFTSSSSGTYCFESTSNIDLVGEVFSNVVCDGTTTGYLQKNDDSGLNYNYRININLSSNQTIYLRTTEYGFDGQGDFSIEVSLSHTHSYNHHYSLYSLTKHRAYCSCGQVSLQSHVPDLDNIYNLNGYNYSDCIYCGASVEL